MASRFDTDTAAVPTGTGTYAARVDPGWWIERGPNGGYVAAIVMQAFLAEVADPERPARSLTVHYLAPAVEGPAQLTVTTERRGRRAQFLTARMAQGDRLVATAQAAFATPDDAAPAFADPSFPGFPPPERIEHLADPPGLVPMRQRYEFRHVTGAPWDSPGHTAEVSGWIRLGEPRPYDAALIAALSDAWYPALRSRIADRIGMPTVDLTVHIRSHAAIAALRPDDWVATRFRTTIAAEGFIEEDGELWAPDGTLIAHSRQLGMLLVP